LPRHPAQSAPGAEGHQFPPQSRPLHGPGRPAPGRLSVRRGPGRAALKRNGPKERKTGMCDFLRAECAIRQLQSPCADIIWCQDAKRCAECFTEDGEWKIAGLHMRGRAEIEAPFAKLLGLCEKVITTVGVPILEVGQGIATARTYVSENAKLKNGQTAHTI